MAALGEASGFGGVGCYDERNAQRTHATVDMLLTAEHQSAARISTAMIWRGGLARCTAAAAAVRDSAAALTCNLAARERVRYVC